MLRVSFLDSGNISTELTRCFQAAKTARIAVAFLGRGGYSEVAESLKGFLKDERKMTIIIGISNYHTTEWQALDALIKMRRKYEKLDLRYYNHEGFHPKMFIFTTATESWAIIGSSNLTGGGLKKNVEANLLVVGPSTHKLFAQIEIFWNNILERAEILDEQVISKYRASFRKATAVRRTTPISIPKTSLPNTSSISSVDQVKKIFGHAFWKIAPGKQAWQWPHWEKDITAGYEYVAVGWKEIGSLRRIMSNSEESFKKEVERRIRRTKYKSDPTYAARQFWRYCREIKRNDIVVAYSKKTIFAIGRVKGTYYYETKGEASPHRRSVEWIAFPKLIVTGNVMHVLATNNVVNPIRDFSIIGYIQNLMKNAKLLQHA